MEFTCITDINIKIRFGNLLQERKGSVVRYLQQADREA
jgi:hypothetical protein